ncbi:MAG: RNA polymerase sigma factor [Chloroflexota bacterium]
MRNVPAAAEEHRGGGGCANDSGGSHPPASPPDEDLACRALDTPGAFEELVRRYQNRVYSLAYRLTGDGVEAYDLTQEAFLRSYAALKTFRPELRFAPWLYRIATNLCLNFLQSSRVRRGGADPDLVLKVPDRAKQPDSAYEEKEERLDIHAAIGELPPKYRAVVLLRHMQDKSYEEIAAILDLPLNTVRTHLFRARELLRRRLHERER